MPNRGARIWFPPLEGKSFHRSDPPFELDRGAAETHIVQKYECRRTKGSGVEGPRKFWGKWAPPPPGKKNFYEIFFSSQRPHVPARRHVVRFFSPPKMASENGKVESISYCVMSRCHERLTRSREFYSLTLCVFGVVVGASRSVHW